MPTSDVTILIVTYNSEKVIEKCLSALPADIRVIVLDNGSKDSSRDIARRFANVQVVENANIGYGKAANIGLRMSKTKYALLLNPDVVLGTGAIEAMASKADQDATLGVISAKTFHYEKGERIYDRSYQFKNGLFYTDWLVGALMLFNMQAIGKAGMFDENFFLFFEETDLCTRIMKAGYKLAIAEAAEGEHEAGTSTPGSLRVARIRSWHNAWSRAYFYRKHYGIAQSFKKSLSKFVKNLTRLPVSVIAQNERDTAIHLYELMGICAFFLGIKAYRKSGTARII
jgi:N-acetylglucosaminyl-diphospho-decaprenol L-rhamnosyltransferase